MKKFWKYVSVIFLATIILILLCIHDEEPAEVHVKIEPIPTAEMFAHDVEKVYMEWLEESEAEEIKTAPYEFISLDEELQIYLEERCAVHELDFFLMASLMFSESSFRTTAVGDNGNSIGLFQINKVWWQVMADKGLDVKQPKDNIEIGLIIFEELMDKTGWDAEKAIQYYKCGESRGKKLWKQGKKLSSIKGIIDRANEWKEK